MPAITTIFIPGTSACSPIWGSTPTASRIEWARIEPEEGFFSNAELDHYRRMLAVCQEHHLTTMRTYYHFSLPRWFALRGLAE